MNLELVEVGTRLPVLVYQPTVAKLVLTPAVTLGSYPAHYDPDFARSLGHEGVFMDSMPILGLIDRLATDWAGPGTFIVRHEISIVRSLYAGSTIRVEGSVVAIDRQDEGPRTWTTGPIVEIEASVTGGDTRCVVATIGIAQASPPTPRGPGPKW